MQNLKERQRDHCSTQVQSGSIHSAPAEVGEEYLITCAEEKSFSNKEIKINRSANYTAMFKQK